SDMTRDGYVPAAVLDKDPASIWVSQAQLKPDVPDWIGIDMGVPVTVAGLSVTPVQGLAGWPAGFRIETSLDNDTWTPVPGQDYDAGATPYKPQEGPQDFTFATPVTARYVRFFSTRLRGGGSPTTGDFVANDYYLAIADMQVIPG